MIKYVYFVLFLCSSMFLWAQKLTEGSFIERLKQHHPLLRISDLQPQMGSAVLLKAKGNFDPKIYGNLDQKYFDGKQYYSNGDFGIKYPSFLGLTFKAGLEGNRGTYLDPQAKTPSGGLFYGGVSANLGQGLFIDSRRAELRNAAINLKSTQEERRLQINQLIYQGGYAYWDWFLAYHSVVILQEAYEVALQRFNAVKTISILGDRAFIDTVEAGLQVQNRLTLLRDAQANLQESNNALSTFLWDENLIQSMLNEGAKPEETNEIRSSLPLVEWNDSLLTNHPYLKINHFKLEMLNVDRKLKSDRLKPYVELNYNLLNEPVNYNPLSDLDINDYKWGVSVAMPLFLRKERGDAALAGLKIQETEAGILQLRAQLALKIKNALIDLNNSFTQLQIYQQTVNDSKKLLDAERNMFDNGESSLFLVNMRELAYVQSQLKLLEWQTKNKQFGYSLGLATATLF
ncbi:MAG: TolC family protein [Flavobacteriia bacterium]|nr:TolC family protein [Flavobacteriia bacterium]